MAKYNPETETNAINIIGLGTKIKGNISSNSDIRIDGELTGNLTTTGRLVIGESGLISGEIQCKNGDISGKVLGKIQVTEQLSLKSTAKIYGDMIISKLAVEPGCVFTGNCKMESESLNNIRQFGQQSNNEGSSEAI